MRSYMANLAFELGGVGCGYATAIVFWVEILVMLGVVRLPYFRATGLLDKFEWPQLKTILEIAKVGAPIGLTVFLEMAVFSVVGLLIAMEGVTQVAANSVAGNINWATYVIPMSLGAAATQIYLIDQWRESREGELHPA